MLRVYEWVHQLTVTYEHHAFDEKLFNRHIFDPHIFGWYCNECRVAFFKIPQCVKTNFRNFKSRANHYRDVCFTSKQCFWSVGETNKRLFQYVWKRIFATLSRAQIVVETSISPLSSVFGVWWRLTKVCFNVCENYFSQVQVARKSL